MSSALCVVPIFRFLFVLTGGFVSVRRANVKNCLARGFTTLLIPGGVREMRLGRPFNHEVGMYIGHKGFVRMAIQHGRNLAGAINFEENDMAQSCVPTIERMIYHKCGLEGCCCWRNTFCMPLSNRLTTHLALTKVIHVEQDDNPTPEMVDRIHSQYYKEIQRVFAKRQKEFGHADRTLAFYGFEDLEAIYKEGFVKDWVHVPKQAVKLQAVPTPLPEDVPLTAVGTHPPAAGTRLPVDVQVPGQVPDQQEEGGVGP